MGIPICIQCGVGGNPCRCKLVGPTVAFLALGAAAVVEWPIGAMVYIFRHRKGRRIMGHPVITLVSRNSYGSITRQTNEDFKKKVTPQGQGSSDLYLGAHNKDKKQFDFGVAKRHLRVSEARLRASEGGGLVQQYQFVPL